MNIGIASIFSFRPHVEQLVYLARLLQSGGHRIFALTCDASVTACYSNLLRGYSRLRGCPGCIAGGVRSFPIADTDRISTKHRMSLEPAIRRELAESSSYTLHRIETADDSLHPEVLATQDRFSTAVETVVGSAAAWIESRRLDGVLCFNGRMDLTRAVTYACELSQIPFVTVERPWLGHGLQLIPNADCLSLREPVRLGGLYSSSPLTSRQARWAGHLISARFLKKNDLEWRLYNPNAISTTWPTEGSGRRVLILPASNNEIYASHERRSAFSHEMTVGIDLVLNHLGTPSDNTVLRCHPNWSERIGRRDGRLSAQHYEAWAQRRKIFTYRSEDPGDTYDLMRQADIVVVTGGSSGPEAAALGKTVVSLTPTPYLESGLAQHVLGPEDVKSLQVPHASPREIVTRTLRYFYLNASRVPQYVDYVRALEPTKYVFLQGGDPQRLTEIFSSGRLSADDPEVADDDSGESEVIEMILDRNWSTLYAPREEPEMSTMPVERRFLLRWIDGARGLLPRGDR